VTTSTKPRAFGRPLTDNQQKVLQLATEGMDSAEIGRKLYLTEDTVKSHLTAAYKKLGARNRWHAVALTVKQGLVDLGPVVDKWGDEIVTNCTYSVTAQLSRPLFDRELTRLATYDNLQAHNDDAVAGNGMVYAMVQCEDSWNASRMVCIAIRHATGERALVARQVVFKTGQHVTRRPPTIEEAAVRIAANYGEALKVLEDQ
jgi:DNA-binding CsgD family transcriptional regulator